MYDKNRGMTLLELVATLTIAAGLAAAAAPSFQGFLADVRMSTTTNSLVAHINTTRSEAVTRRAPVAICSSTDQASCSATADWGAGWIVFTDSSGEPGVRDGSDMLLHAAQTPEDEVTLESDDTYVRFNAMGMLDPD